MSARRFGVRTPAVVALCDAEPGGVVLAYEAVSGRSLDRIDDERVDDDVLTGLREQLRTLRGHGVAHRDLRLANLFVDDDDAVWLIDFGFAELAVAGARATLGQEALLSALPRLRRGFLSGATRTALQERPYLLDEIRVAIA